MTTSIISYFEKDNSEPHIQVFDWEENLTVKQVIEKFLFPTLKYNLSYNQIIVQQKHEDFISPELQPSTKINQLLSSELFDLHVHRRITEKEADQMLVDMEISDETPPQLSHIAESAPVTIVQNTENQSKDRIKDLANIKMELGQSSLMSQNSLGPVKIDFKSIKSAFNSAKLNLKPISKLDTLMVSSADSILSKQRNKSRELCREYSWQLAYEQQPLYCDRGENVMTQRTAEILEERLERKVYIACSIEIEPMHSLYLDFLVGHAYQLVGFKHNDIYQTPPNLIMQVIRDQYGGWAIVFFQLEKKNILLHAILPICCRYSLEPLVKSKNQPNAQLQPEDSVRSILGLSTFMSTKSNNSNKKSLKSQSSQKQEQNPYLEQPDQIPKHAVIFLLNVDGLSISFKTVFPQAVLLQNALQMCTNETVGEFSREYGSSLLFEDVVKNRMLNLNLFMDLLQCEEFYFQQEVFLKTQALIVNNFKIFIGLENETADFGRWIVKMAMLADDNGLEIYELILEQLRKDYKKLDQCIILLEQIILYPAPMQGETYMNEQKLIDIALLIESEQENGAQTLNTERLRACASRISTLTKEQKFQLNVPLIPRNPPIELVNEVDNEEDEFFDDYYARPRTVSVCVFPVTANGQYLKPLIKKVCAIEDLIIEDTDITRTFLQLIPSLLGQKLNITTQHGLITRAFTQLTKDEDIQIHTILPQLIYFNKKQGIISKRSTAFIFGFCSAKQQIGKSAFDYEQLFQNLYGKSNIGDAFLSIPQQKIIEKDNRIQYFLLVAVRQDNYPLGVKFLINPETMLPFCEQYDTPVKQDDLFKNSLHIGKARQVKDYSNKIKLVTSTLVKDDSQQFASITQISVLFIQRDNPDTFRKLVDTFITQVLPFSELSKFESKEDEKEFKPLKNEFDDSYTKPIKDHIEYTFSQKETELKVNKIKFNSLLQLHSPFFSIFGSSQLQECIDNDELKTFINELYENQVLKNQINNTLTQYQKINEECVVKEAKQKMTDLMVFQIEKVTFDPDTIEIDHQYITDSIKDIEAVVLKALDKCDVQKFEPIWPRVNNKVQDLKIDLRLETMQKQKVSVIKGHSLKSNHFTKAINTSCLHLTHIFSELNVISQAIDTLILDNEQERNQIEVIEDKMKYETPKLKPKKPLNRKVEEIQREIFADDFDF
ncbi:Hypothetical_protein [Hexamita inflata]|uniref:Hypothetical_protein n=1 Tax=Hexamita inflata TaxID=28002 RepID=A0AA86R2R8_9EUKA|nr:Hypothetical protein HINF_LOCUS55767 [Hexamita inflata]